MTDPVCICTYLTPFDAEVARGVLRSEGIDAILSSDDAVAGVMPGAWLATGGVQLFVTGAEAERAVAILSAQRSNEGKIWRRSRAESLGVRPTAHHTALIDVRLTAPAHDWQIRYSISHVAEQASGLVIEVILTRSLWGRVLSIPFLSGEGMYDFGLRAVEYVIKPELGNAENLVQPYATADAVWRFREEYIVQLCDAVSKLAEMLASYVGGEIFFEVAQLERPTWRLQRWRDPKGKAAQSEVSIPIAQLVSDIRAGRLRKRTKYRVDALSANVRETRSTQRIRVGRRQRKRTCWDCEREWKRMVVPLEPGRPSEARQLLRTQR